MRFVSLLLATCSLQAVQAIIEPLLLDLQVDGVHVTASTECGVAADGSSLPTEYAVCAGDGPECVRTCGAGGGEGVEHGAELAVDGDRITSWQSPPLSFYQARGDTLGSHNLTIDLGRAVHVVQVQALSGEGLLPASIELYGSVDGSSFSLLATLTSDDDASAELIANVVEVTSGQRQLTSQQRTDSHARYLQLRLLTPPPSLVTFDPRAVFYSVGEVEVRAVEEEVCSPLSTPSQLCHGEPVARRSIVTLSDATYHRLLWQRTNQSDWWNLDDVMVLVEECPVGLGGCEDGRVSEDFNGTINPLLWDSDSFPPSSFPGPRPCPDPHDPALLISPGDQIISRPLLVGTWAAIFDVGFPLPPPFCLGGAEYFPVEVRQCRSIQGALGECELVGLVSASECGNCLDQLIFELRYLQEAMDSALFPANLTILNELHTNIHNTLNGLEALEALLLVLQVGFGSLNSLPPSALPLPPSLLRLDLQLVPPILSKLQALRDLLDQIPLTVVPMEGLEGLSTAMLDALLAEAEQLQSEQRALSSVVQALLLSISINSSAVLVARTTANQIVVEISRKQYSVTEVRVQTVADDVLEALARANRFLGLARDNSQHSQEVASSLMAVGARLREAGSLATDTVGVANRAQEEVLQIEEVGQEVEALLREALQLLGSGNSTLEEGEVAVVTGEQLLAEARLAYQNSSQTLPEIISLIDQLNGSVQSNQLRLAGILAAPPCAGGGSDCTAGEEHLFQLRADLRYVVNSSVSVYTLRYASDTLAALSSAGKPLDLSLINSTALLAQEEAQEGLLQLGGVNASRLGSVASIVLSSAQQLSESAADSLAASENLSVSVNMSAERRGQLASLLGGQQLELSRLSDRLGGVASLTGLTDEATFLLGRANVSRNEVMGARVRVGEVRDGVEEVEREIGEIRSNLQSAESALQEAEQKFPLVTRLLAASRSQAEAALFNASSFIQENERIVANIDSLISRLADVHSGIGRVNSPVRLSSDADSNAVPYLSLQPPPGQQLGGVAQFEDLDLYLRPSAQYQTPSLLFYAGPVRFPDQDNGTQPNTTEDMVWVLAEEEGLRLGWELGGYRGNRTLPQARVEGNSRLRLSRAGSQLRLQLLPSAAAELLERDLVSGSLLFHSSDRTAFLLGGWPEGAELGSESTPLLVSSLHGFEGQFQLALFNGDLWGLWNVRSTSPTNLVGDREFRRNQLASAVAWHAPRGFPSTASAVSFDGSGYLFTNQFGIDARFSNSFFQTITLILRPNDASSGLVMYAYQPQVSVSLEVFYRDAQVYVLISRHDDVGSEVLVNHTEPATRDEEMQVVVRYIPLRTEFRVNGQSYVDSRSQFFTNLRQVQAWLGGVRDDRLEGTYIPHEKTSYFGCLDMIVQKDTTSVADVFRGSSFTTYYLNSPVQKGFSATCYSTVYVREVSIEAGAEGLAYTYLPLPPPPSRPPSLTLSLSLLPLEVDGLVLAAAAQGSRVAVVLSSAVLEVTLSRGEDSVTLTSRDPLALGVWHTLLLSLDFPSNQPSQFSLFVDGQLQESSELPGFFISLPTSAPVGVANPTPVLFVGGVPLTFDPSNTTPAFTGCLKDLTFDLRPMSFRGPSLVDLHPPGVMYHSCPSSTVVPVPELPVRPAPPEARVCLGAEPVALGHTHGGFTKDTQLRTSNVAGLLDSEWTLSLSVRQRAPGHVISVRSASGGEVQVVVEEGGELSLAVSHGGGAERTAMSPPLPHDVFTATTISCAVVPPNFTCSLMVGGAVGVVTIPLVGEGRNASLFDPALPIALGQTRDSQGRTVDGFEGCLADLAINGDSSGFQGVETGIPCYRQTLPGLGFTGISRIDQLLPAPGSLPSGEVTVALSVRPLLETGIVLALSQGSQPVLVVGLVQGELRVSNFSGGYLTLTESLCDPTNEVTFDLTVSYTENQLSVGVAGSDPITLAPPPSVPALEQLLLTLGNVPEELQSGASRFSFLLSADVPPSSLPAGLAGCLTSATVLGGPVSPGTAENVLYGFCPDG